MYLFVSMGSRLCHLAQILQIMGKRNPDPVILPVMSVLKQVLAKLLYQRSMFSNINRCV